MNLPRPPAQDFIIVGATGDLSRRKLLPALYNLYAGGLIPELCGIVGFARSDLDEKGFRQMTRQAIEAHSRSGIDGRVWEDFASRLSFVRLSDQGYKALAEQCKEAERTFYLAVPPDSVPEVVRNIGQFGLATGARVVVEKPFGTDLASARQLNQVLHEVFREQQIFRIDHYLGKETVQNILVFRFANSVFERVWQREAIDHIQITVAESIGIEGRGSFYEEVGALRDIVQNHVLQMLALLTMEPPFSFAAEAIRDEKSKLLHAVRPVNPRHVVRGQYTAGAVDGEKAVAYREEPGVALDSRTETFIALRLDIDNWRWAGVPIYLRTGKRLPYRATEVELAFKEAPIHYVEGARLEHSNHLTLRIQPEEKITFEFLAKVPGPSIQAKQVNMDFSYEQAFMVEPAEAYERLLHDVMQGDQTLFVREDAVERSWMIVQPLLDEPPPLSFYPAGTWGPQEAMALVAPHQWHLR
jgi:glucose-6-phosphate 1-dehydrogenase